MNTVNQLAVEDAGDFSVMTQQFDANVEKDG